MLGLNCSPAVAEDSPLDEFVASESTAGSIIGTCSANGINH
jgi:hypothetical protein